LEQEVGQLQQVLGYETFNLNLGDKISGWAKILSHLNIVKIRFGGYAGSNLMNIRTKAAGA
jgi:hypothetical protein